jgi:putative DNA-invertase from lambdoid prophage Rac
LRDLAAFAERGGYEVVDTFRETASGMKANRSARAEVMKLAQARHIDAILVTELSRWGRATQNLLDTLNRLSGRRVSVVVMSGMTFEVDTPHGRMMATMLAGIVQFERDMLSERVRSGLAAARARGRKLGRQTGDRPKSDRLAPRCWRSSPRDAAIAGSHATAALARTPSPRSSDGPRRTPSASLKWAKEQLHMTGGLEASVPKFSGGRPAPTARRTRAPAGRG